MRVGLVARADNSGLGIQTHEFYRHMNPHKTMVVDISRMNGNRIYPERYNDRAVLIPGFPVEEDLRGFLEDLDVVFVAESPYNYRLYSLAREMGVKTAVQYNYEFFDWFANPDYPKPDMLIAPSKWCYDRIDAWCKENNIEHTYLHCPVNRDVCKFREIKQARTFLHNAGKSASFDRNGTETVIAATKYLKTDAKVIIHFQGEQGLAHQTTNTIDDYQEFVALNGDATKIEWIQTDYENYWDAYGQGDVLLLPRRYGGNCLPLNEALSIGMPVIMTDISPNNQFLPGHWLVSAEKVSEFTPRVTVDIYGAKPEDLAAKIDYFYLMDEQHMSIENDSANYLADTISWTTLKPEYERTFEKLCTPQ